MKKSFLSNKFCYIVLVLFILSIFLLFIVVTLFPKYNMFAYLLVVGFNLLMNIFLLVILIFSLQTLQIDEKYIIQQNPLRKAIIMSWDEIKSIEVINFVFKSIYISNKNLTKGEKLHLSPFNPENGIIRISYSKKLLKEIKKYYQGNILNE